MMNRNSEVSPDISQQLLQMRGVQDKDCLLPVWSDVESEATDCEPLGLLGEFGRWRLAGRFAVCREVCIMLVCREHTSAASSICAKQVRLSNGTA